MHACCDGPLGAVMLALRPSCIKAATAKKSCRDSCTNLTNHPAKIAQLTATRCSPSHDFVVAAVVVYVQTITNPKSKSTVLIDTAAKKACELIVHVHLCRAGLGQCVCLQLPPALEKLSKSV